MAFATSWPNRSTALVPRAGSYSARSGWAIYDASTSELGGRLDGPVVDRGARTTNAKPHDTRGASQNRHVAVASFRCLVQRMPVNDYRLRSHPVVNVIYRLPPRRDWLRHRRYLALPTRASIRLRSTVLAKSDPAKIRTHDWRPFREHRSRSASSSSSDYAWHERDSSRDLLRPWQRPMASRREFAQWTWPLSVAWKSVKHMLEWTLL